MTHNAEKDAPWFVRLVRPLCDWWDDFWADQDDYPWEQR